MDPTTILRYEFVNWAVSYPGLRPFFFHAELHVSFAHVDYSVITMRFVEELLEKGVVVVEVVVDDLFCQQAGLCSMTESAQNPRITGLIILPCANHMSNLVCAIPSKETKNLRYISDRLKHFRGLCGKTQPFGILGKYA
jgi:hypothetical protein